MVKRLRFAASPHGPTETVRPLPRSPPAIFSQPPLYPRRGVGSDPGNTPPCLSVYGKYTDGGEHRFLGAARRCKRLEKRAPFSRRSEASWQGGLAGGGV